MGTYYDEWKKSKKNKTESVVNEWLDKKYANKASDLKTSYLSQLSDSEKFGEYNAVMQNTDFAEKSQYVPKNQNWIQKRIGNDAVDLISESINDNPVGINSVTENINTSYLTPNEKAVFNYLYNTGDKASAYKLYEDLIEDTYKRYNEYSAIEKNTRINNLGTFIGESVKSVPASIYGGINQVVAGTGGAAIGAISGQGAAEGWNKAAIMNPYSAYSEAIRGGGSNYLTTATGSEKIAPLIYQSLMSVADSMVVGMLGGAALKGIPVGTKAYKTAEKLMKALAVVPMSGSAARSKAVEVLNNGGTEQEAALSSLLSGAIEYATEMIGMDTTFDILTGKMKAETAKKFIKKALLAQAGAEAAEEGLSDLGNLITDYLVLDLNKTGAESEWMAYYHDLIKKGDSEGTAKAKTVKAFIANLGLDVLGGAIGGVFGGSVESLARIGNYRKTGNAINQNENVGPLTEQLEREGKTNIAETLRNNPTNLNVGYAQDTLIREATDKINSDNATLEDYEKYNQTIDEAIANTASKTGITDKKGNNLHLKNIEYDDGYVFVTEEGTYKASDVRVSDSMQRLMNLAEDIPDAARQAYIENYKGGNLGDYTRNFEIAYELGRRDLNDKENFPEVSDGLTRLVSEGFSAEQAMNIYNAGRVDKASATSKLLESQKAIDRNKNENPTQKAEAKVDTSRIKSTKLNDNQLKNVKLAKYLSKAFNVNVSFYDSKNDNTSLKYANGAYDEKTNTIWLDVNATNSGTGQKSMTNAIITTMSHELTHWAKANAALNYASFRKTMLTSLAREWGKLTQDEDLDVASFVYQMKEATPAYENLSDEEVEDELIARACENMLQNSNFAKEALGRMTARERKNIGDKVHELFEKILNLIREIMGRSDSNSTMYQLLARDAEEMEKRQAEWDAMIKEAAENSAYKNAQVEKVKKAYDAVTVDYTLPQNEKKSFSLKETVESTDKLMAVHNVDQKYLLKTLKLGGFACPSIAIKRAYVPHIGYGDCTVVFGKATINPEWNKGNNVWSGDAWTPTFPHTELKISDKKRKKIKDKIEALVGTDNYNRLGYMLDDTNMSNELNRTSGDVVKAYGKSDEMKYAFLQDTGKGFDLPMKGKQLSVVSNDALGAIALVLGDETLNQMHEEGYRYYDEHPEVIDRLRVLANEAYYRENSEEVDKLRQRIEKEPKIFLKNILENYKHFFDDEEGKFAFSKYDHFVRNMWYVRNNKNLTELDQDTLKQKLKETVNEEEYSKWLADTFDGIIEKEGIRNNLDYYSPSGNPRSFNALHYELTLENVVKVMTQQEQQGTAMSLFDAEHIWGVSTRKFKSIDDMRSEMGRLLTDESDIIKEKRQEYTDQLLKIATDIHDVSEPNNFIALNQASSAIVDSLRGAKTEASINRRLKEYGRLNIKPDTAKRILALYNGILTIPTKYFEAKPMRAVGLDEIAYVAVPSNPDPELIKALDDNGIAHYTYEEGNDENRTKVTNDHLEDFDNVLFSAKEGLSSEDFKKHLTKSAAYESIHNIIRYNMANDVNIRGRYGFAFDADSFYTYEIIDKKDLEYRILENLPIVKNEKALKGVCHAIKRDKYSYNDREFSKFLSDIRAAGRVYLGDSNTITRAEIDRTTDVLRSFIARERAKKRQEKNGRADTGESNRNISKDSEGKELSSGQVIYFENSKIRDKNGNLLLVYHGTPTGGFTVFRNGLTYFTANKDYAKRYTGTNGSGRQGSTPQIYAGYINITKPFTLTDKEAKRIYIEEYIKGGYAQGMNPYASAAEIRKYAENGIDWNEADNLKDFFDEMGYDYDGLILNEGGDLTEKGTVMRGDSYVTFNQDQFKNQDNLNPTHDPDIRYSIKDEHTLGFTNERIDQLLTDRLYGSTNPNYAQAYITYMSPDTFLKLTTGKNQRGLERIKTWDAEKGEFSADKFADEFNSQPIRLTIDEENNEVYGHEGRHRMWQLKQKGINRVPVLLFNPDNKESKKPIESISLMPQWFSELDDDLNDLDRVTVRDLLPFSTGNIDKIKEKFGTGSEAGYVFSWKDDEGYLHLDFDDVLSPEDLEKYLNKVNGRNARIEAHLRKLNKEIKDNVVINNAALTRFAKKIKETYELGATLKDITEELRNAFMKVTDVEAFNKAASDVAQKLTKTAQFTHVNKEMKEESDRLKKELRSYSFALSETQKKELKYVYGSNWSQQFLGKVKFRKDGTPLDSLWSTFMSEYPQLFEDTTDADEGVKLAEVVNAIYSGDYYTSDAIDDSKERISDMITDIREASWNVTENLTMAEKYHEAMEELRERIRSAKEEVRTEAQRQRLIARIVEREMNLAKMAKNDKDNHIPDVLKEPLKRVIETVNIESKVSTETMSNNLTALAKMLEDVSTQDEAMENLGMYFDTAGYFIQNVREIADELQKKVDKLTSDTRKGTSILDLSIDSLKKLNEALAAITSAARNYDKVLATDTQMRISDRSTSSMRFLSGISERKQMNEVVKKAISFFAWDNTTPVYGYDRFGEGGRETFKGIMAGDDQLTLNSEQIINFEKQTFTGQEAVDWEKELQTVTINGKEYDMTTAQIMSLYCLSKRQAAQQHLYTAKNVYGEEIEGQGIVIGATKAREKTTPIKVTKSDIEYITSLLTDRQREVADKLQTFMSTVCSDWGNYVTMRRFGIMQFGEENYFPMTVFRENSPSMPQEIPQQASIFKLLNMGFTKSLNERGNGALELDSIFNVFDKHAAEMAEYNAFALPILDAYKWLSYKTEGPGGVRSFKTLTRLAYGEDGMKFIINHLEDLNGTRNTTSSAEQMAKSIIRRYKTAATAANLRVVVMQPMSYVRAMNEIDLKYLRRAIDIRPSSLKKTIVEMNEKSALAKKKNGLGAFDLNISRTIAEQGRQIEDVKGIKGFTEKAMNIAMWAAQKADEITWGTLYKAVQLETADKHPDLKGEAFDAEVNERFRDICYRTQVFDSINARSNLMRKKDIWHQIVTAFGSEPTLSYSMLTNDVFMFAVEARNGNQQRAWSKYGKKIQRAMISFIMSAVAVSAVSAVPDWLRDDEDDEGFLKTYFSNFGLNLISEVTGLLPWIRDISSVAIEGYDPSRPDEEILKTVGQTYKAVTKAFENGEITYRTVYQAAKLFSQMSGIPLGNLVRDFKALWNKTIGEVFGMKIS